MTALLWIRNDLRLKDHEALLQAAQMGCPVYPLYIDETHPQRPLGGAAKWWLHHSLTHLNASLGGMLAVYKGGALEIFRTIFQDHDPDALNIHDVFWNTRADPTGALVDSQIESFLNQKGIRVHPLPGNFLFNPAAHKSAIGKPFQVFGAYQRACLRLPPPNYPKSLANSVCWKRLPGSLSLSELSLLPTQPDWSGGLREAWTPGEDGAQRALDTFLNKALEDYGDQRNRLDGPTTSMLGPYLHFGEISIRQVWHAALACSDSQTPEGNAFLSELIWRDFAAHLLAHYPQLPSDPLRVTFRQFPWPETDPHLLESWRFGYTGYPIVDAAMRQLYTMGWINGRARMIAASFLTKHLLIPWQVGEAWFWDTLVDADLASNGMNWQWVAGCGVDAAPYFRIFNPVLQGEKFDPLGIYVKRWVPELRNLPASVIHQPWNATFRILQEARITLGTTYPKPIVDHGIARTRALAAYSSLKNESGERQ